MNHEDKQVVIAKSLLGPSINFHDNLIQESCDNAIEECKGLFVNVVLRRAFKNVRNTLKFFNKKKLYIMAYGNKYLSGAESVKNYTKTELIDRIVKYHLATKIQAYVRIKLEEIEKEKN